METLRPRPELATQLDASTPFTSARIPYDRACHQRIVPLGWGRSLQLHAGPDEARLCIRAALHGELSITIRFEQSGPVVSVQARELQLTSIENITAVCDTFAVHARERIELHSDGALVQHAKDVARLSGRHVEVEATPGAIRMKANDEVQLLGEMILLNCDHPSTLPQTPSWAQPEQSLPALPAEASCGDADVVAELLGR